MSDDPDSVVMRTKPENTIAGLKRLAEEMEWMLKLLKDRKDSIDISINRDNGRFKIALSIDLQSGKGE